jgi:hypothetical protein
MSAGASATPQRGVEPENDIGAIMPEEARVFA